MIIPDYIAILGGSTAAVGVAVTAALISLKDHRYKTVEKFNGLSNTLMRRIEQVESHASRLEREREIDREWISLLCEHIRLGSPPPPPPRPIREAD